MKEQGTGLSVPCGYKEAVAVEKIDAEDDTWSFCARYSVPVSKINGVDIRIHLVAIASAIAWFFLKFDLYVFSIIIIVLLIHEIGHSWAAVACNVRVRGIILVPPFAALTIADIENCKKPFPYVPILMAGSASNLFIGGILSLFKWSLYELFGFDLWLYEFIISANFIIGCFNLLPFYPLDGGKVIHSLFMYRLCEEKADKYTLFSSCVCFFAVSWWTLRNNDYIDFCLAVPLMVLAFITFKEKEVNKI